MNESPDLRLAAASEVAAVLGSGEASNAQLQAALANALNRIAAMESDWEELGRMARIFNEGVTGKAPSEEP